jgi:hypothetical protein
MKHQLGKSKTTEVTPSQINAATAAKALAQAEKELVKPPSAAEEPQWIGGAHITHTDGRVYVDLNTKQIATRIELFQPRRFSAGLRAVDPHHVKKLKTRIDRKGELDPVLVVRLGDEWVCVDGHHRIAAYGQKKPNGTIIKCEWFRGSALEAANESLKRNEVIKLPVNQSDRFEEAWRRTVNGWGSKREVVELTGTSEGVVAMMRRVVKQHGEQSTPHGRELRAKLGPDLSTYSWSRVRAEWVGIEMTPGERDKQADAAKLARRINNKLTNLLSMDAAVTAEALWIYDQDLCRELVEELKQCVERETRRETEGAQGTEETDADDAPLTSLRSTGTA